MFLKQVHDTKTTPDYKNIVLLFVKKIWILKCGIVSCGNKCYVFPYKQSKNHCTESHIYSMKLLLLLKIKRQSFRKTSLDTQSYE